jgi:hypothetical protein
MTPPGSARWRAAGKSVQTATGTLKGKYPYMSPDRPGSARPGLLRPRPSRTGATVLNFSIWRLRRRRVRRRPRGTLPLIQTSTLRFARSSASG